MSQASPGLLDVANAFAHAKRALRPTGALKGDASCVNQRVDVACQRAGSGTISI